MKRDSPLSDDDYYGAGSSKRRSIIHDDYHTAPALMPIKAMENTTTILPVLDNVESERSERLREGKCAIAESQITRTLDEQSDDYSESGSEVVSDEDDDDDDDEEEEEEEEEEENDSLEAARAVFYDGLYAPSSYDIMGILIRVASRPNPVIDIGPVDTNVALVLVDSYAPDCPIVYCSEGFEHLTGYNQTEILGRNCRFLQSPPSSISKIKGKAFQEARTPSSSLQLSAFKSQVMSGREAQVTITNYTKDGKAFTNILTAIPINWGNDSPPDQRRYIVGFQANRQNVVFTC